MTNSMLTKSEIKTVRLMVKGLSNREICEISGCKNNTIRTRISLIYDKLSVKNRSEAISKALKLDI